MKDRSALKADRLPKALIAVVATSGLAVMLFILYFLFRESLPVPGKRRWEPF